MAAACQSEFRSEVCPEQVVVNHGMSDPKIKLVSVKERRKDVLSDNAIG